MQVTQIEKIDSKKYAVSFDYEFYGLLYYSEIKKLKIKIGAQIEEDTLADFEKTVLLPRGKRKLIAYLARMDHTCKECYGNLQKAGFPQHITEHVIEYGVFQGYIDDRQYVSDYYHAKKDKKSIKMIQMDLRRKGISSELLCLLDEKQDHSELLQQKVIRYLHKKGENSYENRCKTIQYFVRKGYDASLIRYILDTCSENRDE